MESEQLLKQTTDLCYSIITTEADKKTKKYLIDRLLRYFGSYKPLGVSLKANERAKEMNIGDIRRFTWRNQPTLMKDPGRKIFHWEHKIPLKEICYKVLDSNSKQEIESHIKEIQIVWILKEEDHLLNKGMNGKSWRINRPSDAYEQLGIKLLD